MYDVQVRISLSSVVDLSKADIPWKLVQICLIYVVHKLWWLLLVAVLLLYYILVAGSHSRSGEQILAIIFFKCYLL